MNTSKRYLTDQSIISSILNTATQEQGFQALLDKYQERLYWHIRRIVLVHEDADDVLQNVWVKVFRNISKFNNKSSLYTWLYRIATNEALTHNSKRKLQTNVLEGSVAHLLQSDPYFEGSVAVLQLKTAIAKLPEKQMLVFNMKYYEEMKYSEISEILGTSIGGLKASYHHAVAKIKASIKQSIL